MYVQPGLAPNTHLMSPAWGAFGFVDLLRHHPLFVFICFVIRFVCKQRLCVF